MAELSANAGINVDTAEVTPVRRQRRVGWLFFASLAWIALVGLSAIFANVLPIPSPTDIDMLGKRAPPSWEHWLGNDQLGRDKSPPACRARRRSRRSSPAPAARR